ncbi:MAG: carbonic anhydrase [Parachlamydiaceae bacterium]|nr:carbonic anhydrase [Parachlamydiaceae bacterium]
MNMLSPRFYAALFVLALGPLIATAAEDNNSTKNSFEKLIQGNQRYVNSTTVCHDDWIAKRVAQVEGQTPFAVIVTCSDSRVPPEIIFDQALGALFVVRVAGNVIDDIALGSIEYGVDILKANIILVLGHANCGAVQAALKGMKFDNHIQDVLAAIQPAVNATKGQSGDLLEKTIRANVMLVEEKLKTSKPVLANLIEKGSLRIIGAYYDLASGKVDYREKP